MANKTNKEQKQEQKQAQLKRFTDVNGVTMIFKHTLDNGKDLYSTTISGKNAQGDYKNMYLDVKFVGVKQPKKEMTKVYIEKGFLSLNVYEKDDEEIVKLVLIIQDYSAITEDGERIKAPKLEKKKEENDDMPF